MDGAQRLAQVFVELADTLVEEFDVLDLLQMLTERCVELLHADAAGLMLADERGNLRLMASSTERMRLVELFELQVDEGPCRDCYLTGRAVTNVSLSDAHDRWPVFTVAAMAGVRPYPCTADAPARPGHRCLEPLHRRAGRPER